MTFMVVKVVLVRCPSENLGFPLFTVIFYLFLLFYEGKRGIR